MQSSRRVPLSQHFLWNRRLVDRLVRVSTLTPQDTVLEIGPGRGILTQALLRAADRVVAVEVDPRLCQLLRRRFGAHPNFTLIQADFLDYALPIAPYAVFASLPYEHTSAILRKLLEAPQPPTSAAIVIQREAAAKWCPHARGNHLVALLHYPFWEVRVVYHFQRGDFSPPPRVDSVLLQLTRRAAPLLAGQWKSLYQDYAAHRFQHDRRASDLSPQQFLAAFRSQVQLARPAHHQPFRGAYARLQAQQQGLQKIHRTRADPHWKRFKR
jgi:23S rRNA (adenine-N6)-dimethyltransferase